MFSHPGCSAETHGRCDIPPDRRTVHVVNSTQKPRSRRWDNDVVAEENTSRMNRMFPMCALEPVGVNIASGGEIDGIS